MSNDFETIEELFVMLLCYIVSAIITSNLFGWFICSETFKAQTYKSYLKYKIIINPLVFRLLDKLISEKTKHVQNNFIKLFEECHLTPRKLFSSSSLKTNKIVAKFHNFTQNLSYNSIFPKYSPRYKPTKPKKGILDDKCRVLS